MKLALFRAMGPEFIIGTMILTIMILSRWFRINSRISKWFCFLGLTCSLIVTFARYSDRAIQVGGIYIDDAFTLLFKILAICFTIVFLGKFKKNVLNNDVYSYSVPLVLMCLLGIIFTAGATDLFILFFGFEASIISFTILYLIRIPASKRRQSPLLINQMTGSGILLFGMATLYSITGKIFFPAANQNIYSSGKANPELLALATILILVSIFFKTGAIVFHSLLSENNCNQYPRLTIFTSVSLALLTFASCSRLIISIKTLNVPGLELGLNILPLSFAIGSYILAIRNKHLLKRFVFLIFAHQWLAISTLSITRNFHTVLAELNCISSGINMLVVLIIGFGTLLILDPLWDSRKTNSSKTGERTRPIAVYLALAFVCGAPPLFGFTSFLLMIGTFATEYFFLSASALILNFFLCLVILVKICLQDSISGSFNSKISFWTQLTTISIIVFLLVISLIPSIFGDLTHNAAKCIS